MQAELLASLLQSSVSHDPSEIIHADLLLIRHFFFIIIIINIKNSCGAFLFYFIFGNHDILPSKSLGSVILNIKYKIIN